MPRISTRFTLLTLLILAVSVRGNWEKTWERFQVNVHLENTGSVAIEERMTVRLDGDMETLERPLSTGPDQAIVFRRLVREDAFGDRVLTEGDRRERDRYDFTDGVLTWGIKPPEGAWKNETFVFRVEYELRNALAPAWDIPMSPERFGSWGEYRDLPGRMRSAFAAWRDAGIGVGKRYRYEHEVRSPPFPATGPRETNYTIKYDTAWRMVFPDREVGRGAEECYRSSLLFDFLPPGTPAAIELWRPLVRVGSLLIVALATVVLSALWFFMEWPVRGWWRERLDRAWFAKEIAPMPPEALAWFADRPVSGQLDAFLARMRHLGVLTIQTVPDADPKVTMRLLKSPSSSVPYEREMMSRIFPSGNESGTEVLAQHTKRTASIQRVH